MYYLSNFARTKGAKDKRKRKVRLIPNALGAMAVTSGAFTPFLYKVEKNMANDLARKEIATRGMVDYYSPNKSLENEFAQTLLNNPNAKNVREDAFNLAKERYGKGSLKRAFKGSLPMVATAGLGSLYINFLRNQLEERRRIADKIRKNKKKNQSTKSDRK